MDSHGRSMSSEAIGRVHARRAEVRNERDVDDGKRTIRLFFGANPEMLTLMNSPKALEAHVTAISAVIKAKVGTVDRINFTQLKDSTSIHTSTWAVYVVVEKGSTIEAWATKVDWVGLKWIVYRTDCTPIKVRTSNETLRAIGGRKQCCFQVPDHCRGTESAPGACLARGAAYKKVRFASSVPTSPFKAEKIQRRKDIDLHS
jgi:hypothetical protein